MGVVIVGGGQAAVSTAEALRKNGYEGDVSIHTDETYAPYQRPPLSKAYLLDDMTVERLYLKSDNWYEDQSVELVRESRITEINRSDKTIVNGKGETFAYNHLVLATGSAPRRLPPALEKGLGGLYYLRAIPEFDDIRHELKEGRSLVVVGGGYIGLEFAAVARKRGMTVTLLEQADRLLARVASTETAHWLADLHRGHGVDLRLGVGLSQLEGDGKVEAVVTSEGERIEADCVVIGIGAAPNQALAEAAGLEIENGIAVNAHGQTSDPAIWAVGDCANYQLSSGSMRLESVGNAIDTGSLVAMNIAGHESAYAPAPWFWSDQYDKKLQIAGLSHPDDEVVVRASEKEGLSHWYFRNGKFVAVDALQSPKAYMAGKRILSNGASPSAELLLDPDKDIMTVMREAR